MIPLRILNEAAVMSSKRVILGFSGSHHGSLISSASESYSESESADSLWLTLNVGFVSMELMTLVSEGLEKFHLLSKTLLFAANNTSGPNIKANKIMKMLSLNLSGIQTEVKHPVAAKLPSTIFFQNKCIFFVVAISKYHKLD